MSELIFAGRPAAAGWPDQLFAPGAAFPAVELETEAGQTVLLNSSGWHDPPDLADRIVLGRCRGPVLDIGCGPGRLVGALAERGRQALGIDISSAAVAAARRRGAQAARASVFGIVPGAGRWGTALLLDGNIGIGGEVARLLGRVRSLLASRGQVLIETASPLATSGQARVRVRYPVEASGWFPWAWVTSADLCHQAAQSGLDVDDVWSLAGRWFVQLRVRPFGDRR